MYDEIARFYDLTHASLTSDISFVLQLASESNGPILELGCGTGRLLLPLAQAGHDVVGLDRSVEMLARAKARLAQASSECQARVKLHQAEMTEFILDQVVPFGLVLISYNTFLHLNSVEAAAALRQAHRCLAEDGRLFIDLANPVDIAATPEDALLSLENVLTDPETGELVVHLASNRLDTAAQTLHITWIYDVSPAAGGPVGRTVAQGTYHYRYPHQMALLLGEAKFKVQHFWGGYDRSSYDEASERLLILAEKA